MDGQTNRRIVTAHDFVRAAGAGESVETAIVAKQFNAELRAVDEAKRTVDFAITTAGLDRDNDTIEAGGWELDNYEKNPVVLWAHDYWFPPVGKALNIRAEGGKLISTAQFAPREVHEFADTVFGLLVGGYLNAVSVGFIPLEWAERGGEDERYGVDFVRQELLEYSVVPVPSNPQALVEARAKGINVGPMLNWARNLLDGVGVLDAVKDCAPEQVAFPMAAARGVFAALDDGKRRTIMVTIDPDVTDGGKAMKESKTEGEAAETKQAIASHATGTSDEPWDGAEAVKNTRSGEDPPYYGLVFAWRDPDTDPELKTAYKFPHHFVSEDGDPGAASTVACTSGIGALNGARGGADIPEDDRQGVYNHLVRHLDDAGVEAPELQSVEEDAMDSTGISQKATKAEKAAVDVSGIKIDVNPFLASDLRNLAATANAAAARLEAKSAGSEEDLQEAAKVAETAADILAVADATKAENGEKQDAEPASGLDTEDSSGDHGDMAEADSSSTKQDGDDLGAALAAIAEAIATLAGKMDTILDLVALEGGEGEADEAPLDGVEGAETESAEPAADEDIEDVPADVADAIGAAIANALAKNQDEIKLAVTGQLPGRTN